MIEVLGIEATAAQTVQRRRSEHRQCPGNGITSQRVPRDIKAQAIGGKEKRLDRPVLAVLLMPGSASEEKFDEWLIRRTAITARAQLLSAHTRQVQNRRDIGRRRIWERSVHDALEPNRWSCPRLRVVVTQREQVGQLGSETRYDWPPSSILVRPENGDWRYRALWGVQCALEGGDQPFDERLGLCCAMSSLGTTGFHGRRAGGVCAIRRAGTFVDMVEERLPALVHASRFADSS